MKKENITPSKERFVPAQYIRSDGTIETYSNYMVSDRGSVASVKGKVMKILKPQHSNKLGYLQVCLYVNGKKYIRTVHRAVLSSFHPEQYFEGAEADHIDRDVTNNQLANLHWTDRNGNNANRVLNPLKRIRVTYLSDGHIEEFDNMRNCSKAFCKNEKWCSEIIYRRSGFHKGLSILIEKIP